MGNTGEPGSELNERSTAFFFFYYSPRPSPSRPRLRLLFFSFRAIYSPSRKLGPLP